MFGIEGNLKNALYAAIRPIVTAHKANVALGHICRGPLSDPGSLRMTNILLAKDTLCPMTECGGLTSAIHETAFKKHILHVGRSALLLDWITAFMYRRIDLQDGTPRATERMAVLVAQTNQPLQASKTLDELTISRQLFDALVPDDIVRQYFAGLYRARPAGRTGHLTPRETYDTQRMLGCRLRAQELIAGNRPSVSAFSRIVKARHDRAEVSCRWNVIGALQTALLFLWGSAASRRTVTGFVSVGCCFNVRDDGDKYGNPLLVVSTALPQGVTDWHLFADSVTQCIRDNRIETVLRGLAAKETVPDRHRLGQVKYRRLNPSLVESELAGALVRRVDHAFPGWVISLLLWLGFVAERLRDAVHEGRSLDFCFAVGDRSEIEDSNLFDIVELRWKGTENMVPWDKNGDLGCRMRAEEKYIQCLLEDLRLEIAQKNYAWFEGGRYALLWDLTFPDRRPKCLIRLRDSSWNVYVDQARMQRPRRAHEVAIALAFVLADGTGGMIVGGREVVSFRKQGAWESNKSALYQGVKQEVAVGIEKLGSMQQRKDVVRLLTDALVAVSEDPSAGCMLVLSRARREDGFRDMGSPWRTVTQEKPLSMSLDELKSLMSMDGATCVSVRDRKPVLSFRRLVTGRGQAPRLTKRARGRLDGQGSRKWSAAAAAAHKAVAKIIAVSQDGPVYVFERIRDAGTMKVDVRMLGEDSVPGSSGAGGTL